MPNDQRPLITINPTIQFGHPTINGTRLTAEAVAGYIAAGDSVEHIAEEYDITRADVLVACWYMGRYGTPAWRRRWRVWAEVVGPALWHCQYDVPDPPGGT